MIDKLCSYFLSRPSIFYVFVVCCLHSFIMPFSFLVNTGPTDTRYVFHVCRIYDVEIVRGTIIDIELTSRRQTRHEDFDKRIDSVVLSSEIWMYTLVDTRNKK